MVYSFLQVFLFLIKSFKLNLYNKFSFKINLTGVFFCKITLNFIKISAVNNYEF